jgi:hypothetical protein
VRRWYRDRFDVNDISLMKLREARNEGPVALRCPCGSKSVSVRQALQHRLDYHTPGLCTVRMLKDVTEEWLEDWRDAQKRRQSLDQLYRQAFPMTYGDVMRANANKYPS